MPYCIREQNITAVPPIVRKGFIGGGASPWPTDLPTLVTGEYFLTDEDGVYLTDENGAYLVGKDA